MELLTVTIHLHYLRFDNNIFYSLTFVNSQDLQPVNDSQEAWLKDASLLNLTKFTPEIMSVAVNAKSTTRELVVEAPPFICVVPAGGVLSNFIAVNRVCGSSLRCKSPPTQKSSKSATA